MIATAPGKLIVTGEYAVLDGAPALVLAIDRRAVARVTTGGGSSPFLVAVADELARRRGPDDPATRAALAIAVDSTAFYDGTMKLGLGSSAAVTVAATARALGEAGAPLDRDEVLAIAMAAHAAAQGARGARGSGADVAAAVHGGVTVFTAARVERRTWPASVRLLPFFTGAAADTATLVAQITAARAAEANEKGAVPSSAKMGTVPISAALAAIADASRAACAALTAPADLAGTALVAALALAGAAVERLGTAAGVPLVPPCVRAARSAMSRFGGTAKTTGAGGGDVGIAVIPATADVPEATRALIEAGCRPLPLSVDDAGVDLRSDAS